jgi:hypothetical protein
MGGSICATTTATWLATQPAGWPSTLHRPQSNGALTANRYMNMNPARAESVGIWVGYEYEYEYIPACIKDNRDMNMNISPTQ